MADQFVTFVTIQSTNDNRIQISDSSAGILTYMKEDEFARYAPLCIEVMDDTDQFNDVLIKIQPLTLVYIGPPKDLTFLSQLTKLERLKIVTEFMEPKVTSEINLESIPTLTHFYTDDEDFVGYETFEGHLELVFDLDVDKLECSSLFVNCFNRLPIANNLVHLRIFASENMNLTCFPLLESVIIWKLGGECILPSTVTKFGWQLQGNNEKGKIQCRQYIKDLIILNKFASGENVTELVEEYFIKAFPSMERLWVETRYGEELVWGCNSLGNIL